MFILASLAILAVSKAYFNLEGPSSPTHNRIRALLMPPSAVSK